MEALFTETIAPFKYIFKRSIFMKRVVRITNFILTLIKEVILLEFEFCGDGDVLFVRLTGPFEDLQFFLSL